MGPGRGAEWGKALENAVGTGKSAVLRRYSAKAVTENKALMKGFMTQVALKPPKPQETSGV